MSVITPPAPRITRYAVSLTGRPFGPGNAQWGYRAKVYQGEVMVYDNVARAFTTAHALTAGQVRWVLANAQ